MKQIFQLIRDIVLIFILTILVFLFLYLNQNKKESNFQTFSGFLPSAASSLTNIQPIKNNRSQKTYSTRNFLWIDSNKQNRTTVLNIDRSHLKKETKIFGLRRGMSNSLFLKRRGFIIIRRRDEMINGQLIEKVKFIVDYKAIFQRNIQYFSELTKQLIASIPEKDFNPVYSFLKFVQHIPYHHSPTHYSGRFINKFFVPLVCLYEQSGDCDSKSLLLSEFLASYPNSNEKMGMVLVYGQGIAHAVLAVRKKPLMGMTSLFVRGSGYYILLEATNPRWSPGFISYRVGKAIKAGFVRFVALN